MRVGKALRPTVKGIRLIDTLNRVHIERLASAALTGEIETHLGQVEAGQRTSEDFMAEMADYANEIVERAKTFEYDEMYADDPPLGDCPACGRPVRESTWFYRCEEQPGVEREDDCPMRFWKDTSGRYLDRGAVEALLRDGVTPVLDGFTARNGRTYKGTIDIDRDEWKLKTHSVEWNEDATSELPEYDVDDKPLGKCPMSDDCEVIETPTHFACRTRLEAEKEDAAYKEARRIAREKKEPMPEKPEKPDHPGITMARTVCKREITRDEFDVYLKTGKTELLTDFTSRFGRPFSATLVLKDTGRHGFEFPPRASQKGAAKDGEGAAKKTTKKAPRKKTTKKTTQKTARRKKTATKKSAAKKASSKKAAKKATTKSARKTSSRKKTAAKSPRKPTEPTASD